MTVSSVKTGEVGLSFALNNNYMEPIGTTLVGSGGVNQVTFNDIPQTYKHLQLRGVARGANDQEGFISFNGDSGNNYAYHDFYADDTTTGVNASISRANIRITALPNQANIVSGFVVDILDYANINKFKTVRVLHGRTYNTYRVMYFGSGLWRNTDAISSFKIVSGSGNIAQHSRFSLYGIRG